MQSSDPFDRLADTWWQDDGVLRGLDTMLAPVRDPFVVGTIARELGPGSHRILDVGAGGGHLSMRLCGAGHVATALDRSFRSAAVGRRHAAAVGHGVDFVAGLGERLPFANATFDAAVCMEVLEHVDDPAAVVAEMARVLRPGGILIFSGPQRTWLTRLGLVWLAQNALDLIPRGTHDWRKLIRPGEMEALLRDSGIEPAATFPVGIAVRDLPAAMTAVAGLLAGRLSYAEAGRRIRLVAGASPAVAYQGFGRRRTLPVT